MKVAFGFKAHSGWSALVVIGDAPGEPQVVDRRRIELVEAEDASWAKQLYHAAENLASKAARDMVDRGILSARRIAEREMQAALTRSREAGHEVVGCGVLTPAPMPDWGVDQILAVHFRMHKAEGVMFPDALARAADGCGTRLITIREKELSEQAERALRTSINDLARRIGVLGKSVGAPWGKDQKSAALAAMIALEGSSH